MKKSRAQKSPLTKEEIAREIKRKQDRRFVTEQFYPALKEATISVDEATMLLNAATALIMEEAMETLRTMRMEEIRNRMVKKLCPDDERLLEIEKLLTQFDTHTLFEARGHFEMMKSVITQMQIDEMRKRTLDSMNVDWDRYLVK